MAKILIPPNHTGKSPISGRLAYENEVVCLFKPLNNYARLKKMMILMVSTFLTVGIILFALPLQAQPTTFCNSGNSGHIQDESVLVSPITFYGWGMDFTVSDFHSIWVHVSVPLPYTNMQGVKWVRPEVQVIGTAGRVSEVHVYSGGAELQRFNVNWVGPNTNYFNKVSPPQAAGYFS